MRFLTLLVLIFITSPAVAALSKEYADFATGPAQHLFTTAERQQWRSLKTDEEARAFIDLFWARRDPTPGTPANEYRQGVEERARVADDRFTQGRLAGSRSDRGKVFVLLGSPTRIRRTGVENVSTIQTPTGPQPEPPREMWEYDQAKSPLALGQPKVEVAFMDQFQTNDWKMERVRGTDYTSVFERVATSFIVQPNLTEAPVFPATGAAAPAAGTTISTETLRTAVDEARAAKASSEMLFLNFGEYVTPGGEYFVPVQLYVPSSAAVRAGTTVTFFGAVDREGGERVAAFEEDVTLAASKEGAYYARSLALAPGSYVGTFGLAKDGKPLAVISRPMALEGLDHKAASVSRLILTDNVYPLSAPQRPTDPFAFGGLQVVPKGDAAFARSGDVGYFFEVRNPAVDAATGQPNVTMQITLSGTTAEGKPVKIIGPAQTAPLQPLNGVPGHFVVGQAMPLATFKPGTYTLAVKVTDATSGATYDLRESFRIVE